MAASEPDWDPQPVIKKVRVYARRMSRTYGDLVELMQEIPSPVWSELNELAEGQRPLSISAHLLAVIEEGADRLERLIGSLRYGVSKERFKESERAWKAGFKTSEKVVSRLLDARDRLEALALDSAPEEGENRP